MKCRILTALLMQTAIVLAGYGRSAAQVFQQNATQRKYLMEQIAALKVYEAYLQKGYDIAKDGTGAISQIKNGDLDLHTARFDSLKSVSSNVRKYSKVKATIQLQQQIISAHQKVYPQLAASNQLSTVELINFNASYEAILKKAAADLEELQLVITSGKLEMTDDARIRFINRLYGSMQRHYSSSLHLNRQALALAASRKRGWKDNSNLKSLYGQ